MGVFPSAITSLDVLCVASYLSKSLYGDTKLLSIAQGYGGLATARL